MNQVFEVWYETKKGEKLLKVSPRQLGIQKNDCFFVEFLQRMVDHGLTFVLNINYILSEIEDSKIAKGEELFLFENNDNNKYYFEGYQIFTKEDKKIFCPEKKIKDTLIRADEFFILQKAS